MKYLLPVVALVIGLPAVAQDLPSSVSSLSLADMQVEAKRKGTEITGTLPSGTRIEIELHADGTLKEIETKGQGFFTLTELGDLIPAGLGRLKSIPAYAQLTSLEVERDGSYDLEGYDDQGRDFDAEISPTGDELKYELDD